MRHMNALLGCTAALVTCLVAGPLLAAVWPDTPQQVTDNGWNDQEPRLFGTYLAYESQVDDTGEGGGIGYDFEMMLYDIETGGPAVRLSQNVRNDTDAHLSATHVVWYEYTHGWIYLHKIATSATQRIPDVEGYYPQYFCNEPRISESFVVWQGRTGATGSYEYDLFVYDIATQELTHLDLNSPESLFPDIDGHYVVYQHAGDIYLFDIESPLSSSNPQPISAANSNDNSYPRISETRVVWHGFDGSDNEIFLFDISTQQVTQLTDNSANDHDPKICGLRVVWETNEDEMTPGGTADGEIVLCEIDPDDPSVRNTLQLTLNDTTDRSPQVSEFVVAWQGKNPVTDLYEVFAWVDGETTQWAMTSMDQNAPQVAGLNVVWSASSNQGGEIWLATCSLNQRPVANAGEDQTAHPGDEVTLDGSDSSDDNYDPLTFRWSFTTRPEGSAAELSDPEAVQTTFFADAPGTYVISLVVSDGFEDSDPDNVTVEAITVLDAAVEELMVAIETVNELDPADFKNRKNAKTLVNKINAALKKIEKGDYDKAIKKLEKDVLAKMDGCAETGAPDKNDWLRTCEAQEAVYRSVALAIELLGDLVP